MASGGEEEEALKSMEEMLQDVQLLELQAKRYVHLFIRGFPRRMQK